VAAELHAELEVKKGAFSLRVDVRFGAGVTAILGPSGAGKSTLVGALVGAIRPDSGVLRFGEARWFDHQMGLFLPPERRHVGVVLQSLALFPHMTALENVVFGIEPTAPARDSGDRRQRAGTWLERLGVAHLAERRPRSFSGGEAQRVALARALAPERDVLVLDEPFSALDDLTRAQVLSALRSAISEGKRERVVVCVTHHLDDVRSLEARVVRLESGRIVAS